MAIQNSGNLNTQTESFSDNQTPKFALPNLDPGAKPLNFYFALLLVIFVGASLTGNVDFQNFFGSASVPNNNSSVAK